jgi:hypothetical protein
VLVQVNEPLQRHCATVISLKQSLAIQKEKRMQYLAAISAVDKKRAQGESPALTELEEVAARARTDFELSTKCISEDFARYKEDRGRELIRIAKEMAVCQTNHCRHIGGLWSALIPQFDMCGNYESSSANSNPFAERVAYVPSASLQKAYSYVDGTSNASKNSMYDELDDEDVMIGV